jgi:hypothetical protein
MGSLGSCAVSPASVLARAFARPRRLRGSLCPGAAAYSPAGDVEIVTASLRRKRVRPAGTPLLVLQQPGVSANARPGHRARPRPPARRRARARFPRIAGRVPRAGPLPTRRRRPHERRGGLRDGTSRFFDHAPPVRLISAAIIVRAGVGGDEGCDVGYFDAGGPEWGSRPSVPGAASRWGLSMGDPAHTVCFRAHGVVIDRRRVAAAGELGT